MGTYARTHTHIYTCMCAYIYKCVCERYIEERERERKRKNKHAYVSSSPIKYLPSCVHTYTKHVYGFEFIDRYIYIPVYECKAIYMFCGCHGLWSRTLWSRVFW